MFRKGFSQFHSFHFRSGFYHFSCLLKTRLGTLFIFPNRNLESRKESIFFSISAASIFLVSAAVTGNKFIKKVQAIDNGTIEKAKQCNLNEDYLSDSNRGDEFCARLKARRFILHLKEKHGIPGVVVAVSKNGNIVYSDAVGYADIENLVPITRETHMRIASISKSLTAVGLALLVEEGKLNLDTPIQNYVPNFPMKSEGIITIRQLASHLSGIRHYKGEEFNSYKAFSSVTDALEIFKCDPLESAPGSKKVYSTFGFTLLSAAMEAVCGMPFLDFMSKRVFTPLEMYDTKPERSTKLMRNTCRYYIRSSSPSPSGSSNNRSVLMNAPCVDVSYKWAGGGFLSTVDDLLRFGNGLLEGKLLRADTLEMLFRDQKDANGNWIHYGLGFEIIDSSQRPLHSTKGEREEIVVGHSGSACGGTSQIVVLPTRGIVVVMLTNLGNAPSLRKKCLRIGEFFA